MASRSVNAYDEGFRDGIRPPPILSVTEWANDNRILTSVSSPNPGPWKTSRTPYLREIMDCLSAHSPVEQIDVMFGSQLGKSESGLNWVGYVVDHSPGPMMVVQPTVDMAKRFSKQRIATLMETPAVREKLRPPRERDSGNTILQKDFPGGTLILTGANSATGLSSAPVRYLFLDEVDRYPPTTDEGDPVELAIARTKNFHNRKVLRTSTPTDSGVSRIESGWEEGDKSRYHVPCPQCRELQVLKWENLKWEEGRPETAHYVCEKNGCVIYEYQKEWFLSEKNGACWIAEKPELSHMHRSFHLSTMYAPLGWFTWEKAVRQWLKATKSKSVEKLKAFINTYLGEPWVEKEGDVPDFRTLYQRREAWKIGTVPAGGLMLVCGTDVQKDRLEALVVAFGAGKRKWLVDRQVFPGDTSDLGPSGPWASHRAFLQTQYEHESGRMMPIRMCGVDSGYNSSTVYTYVREFPRSRVIATRGFDHLKLVIGTPTTVDINLNGRKIRRGLQMYPIGSSLIKTEIYGQLKQAAPTEEEIAESGFPEGFIHFPEFDEDFFRQLTAEQQKKKLLRGFPVYFWEKVYERNEVLDMLAIARAVASLCGVDRMKDEDWVELAKEFLPIERVQESPAPGDIPRRKSNFWK